ncbi:MAG: hypothetical protein HC898_13325 [Phycisphaerales bacterium]|nr:hypothetical protein [Phycisphaerales bacterium]
MPTNMRGYAQGLDKATLGKPWSFTKNLPTLRLGHYQHKDIQREPLLFDLQNDPQQQKPLQDETVKQRMHEHMARLMKDYDAPAESYECMGLTHTMTK